MKIKKLLKKMRNHPFQPSATIVFHEGGMVSVQLMADYGRIRVNETSDSIRNVCALVWRNFRTRSETG